MFGRQPRGRVVVYDGMWSNPYGASIANLLASYYQRVCTVEFYVPADTPRDDASYSPLLRLRRRNARRADSGLADKVRKAMAPVSCAIRAWIRGDVVLVLSTGPYGCAVLGLGARLGVRTAYVVHNPGTDRGWNGETRLEQWIGRASTIVVHHLELTHHLQQVLGVQAMVAHPPLLLDWVARFVPRTPRGNAAIFIGALREDKGASYLENLMEALCKRGADIKLIIAGPDSAFVPRNPERCPTMLDARQGPGLLPDDQLAEAIMASSVCVAPYASATYSSSIALAVACGLNVVCFESPGMRDYVPKENMVAMGDVDAMAERVLDCINRDSTRHIDPAEWNDECAREWARVVEAAKLRRGRTPSNEPVTSDQEAPM